VIIVDCILAMKVAVHYAQDQFFTVKTMDVIVKDARMIIGTIPLASIAQITGVMI